MWTLLNLVRALCEKNGTFDSFPCVASSQQNYDSAALFLFPSFTHVQWRKRENTGAAVSAYSSKVTGVRFEQPHRTFRTAAPRCIREAVRIRQVSEVRRVRPSSARS